MRLVRFCNGQPSALDTHEAAIVSRRKCKIFANIPKRSQLTGIAVFVATVSLLLSRFLSNRGFI